jgi:hypothetical protein
MAALEAERFLVAQQTDVLADASEIPVLTSQF